MVIKEPTGQNEIIYVRPVNRGVIFPFEQDEDFENVYGEGFFEIRVIRYISEDEFKKISENSPLF